MLEVFVYWIANNKYPTGWPLTAKNVNHILFENFSLNFHNWWLIAAIRTNPNNVMHIGVQDFCYILVFAWKVIPVAVFAIPVLITLREMLTEMCFLQRSLKRFHPHVISANDIPITRPSDCTYQMPLHLNCLFLLLVTLFFSYLRTLCLELPFFRVKNRLTKIFSYNDYYLLS